MRKSYSSKSLKTPKIIRIIELVFYKGNGRIEPRLSPLDRGSLI